MEPFYALNISNCQWSKSTINGFAAWKKRSRTLQQNKIWVNWWHVNCWKRCLLSCRNLRTTGVCAMAALEHPYCSFGLLLLRQRWLMCSHTYVFTLDGDFPCWWHKVWSRRIMIIAALNNNNMKHQLIKWKGPLHCRFHQHPTTGSVQCLWPGMQVEICGQLFYMP